MKLRFRLVVLSALAIVVGLSGCEKGPSAPVGTATQEPPTPSAAVGAGSQPTSPQASEFAAAPELRNIHFDLAQARIRSAEARMLENNVRWLKSHRDVVVMVGGHADERGSDEYNARLAERRADAVRRYLIAQGIEADRIATASHGEQRPVCSERTEACWGKNRRAEFQVRSR
jgi:peptidoglycan-associated lipoprotein